MAVDRLEPMPLVDVGLFDLLALETDGGAKSEPGV